MSSEFAPAAPEHSTEQGPSYAKQLEHDLRVAQTDTEKIGAVNGLLESVLTDASQNRLRSVRTDSASGQDIETVYTKEQMENNFAKLYDVLFGDEEQRVSYTVAERLLTRTGGLRPAMEHVLGPNADPKLRAAAEVWLKQKHDEVVARSEHVSDALDESLLETRPRSEVTEIMEAVDAPIEVEEESTSEIGPEELEEIEDELGEVAVEHVVEEPEPVEVAAEQPEEVSTEVLTDEEKRSQEIRALEGATEQLSNYRQTLERRFADFLSDGNHLVIRMQSGDHSAAGIVTSIRTFSEQLPSMVAFVAMVRDQVHQYGNLMKASSVVEEATSDRLEQTLTAFMQRVDAMSDALKTSDRVLDRLAYEAQSGADVHPELRDSLLRIDATVRGMVEVPLVQTLYQSLESIARHQ